MRYNNPQIRISQSALISHISADNLPMEETNSTKLIAEDDEFRDALNEFAFYDCLEAFSESVEPNGYDGSSDPSPEMKAHSSAGLRRRRSQSGRKSSGGDSSELSKISSSASVDDYSRERKVRLSDKIGEHSTITDASDDGRDNARGDVIRDESSLGENNDTDSSLLFVLAGMAIKSIRFQISLLVKIVVFPIYLVYYLYMLVFNPFGLVKLSSGCLIGNMKRIWTFVFGIVSEYVYEWLKEHRAIWRLGLKCGWGLLWSAYVVAVLVGLLVSAFVIGGVLIRVVVEEPIRIKRSLNFDYLEKSPVAFVPIMTHTKLNHGMNLVEKPEILKASGSRVVPRDHRLKATVLLTLPESEYNRHLGIFQVRVDFVSVDGQKLATLRRPCMLQYKSQSIRFLLTLLKIAPILTGYTTETQNLKIHFKDFKEGETPTAFLRVVIEQRAEYSPGAGIPEIYSASLTLESELPLLKRILWFWKKTLFIWISMSIFVTELVFALLCCRPIIIPKIRLREASNRDAPQNNRLDGS